jgi:exonuclease III
VEVSGFSGNLRMTGADDATPPPFRSKGSGTFRMGTYNIITGQGGGILSALRAMGKLGVDVGVLQETKMTKGIYPRRGFGYSVFCTDAPSRQCGGVALFWRDCDGCAVEEQRRWGPNVLSFQLVTGRGRYYCIGAYRPPSEVDNNTAEDINRAWDKCPKGSEPILMGDLNVNLARPQSKWDIAMAEQAAAMDVHDMTLNFR